MPEDVQTTFDLRGAGEKVSSAVRYAKIHVVSAQEFPIGVALKMERLQSHRVMAF